MASNLNLPQALLNASQAFVSLTHHQGGDLAGTRFHSAGMRRVPVCWSVGPPIHSPIPCGWKEAWMAKHGIWKPQVCRTAWDQQAVWASYSQRSKGLLLSKRHGDWFQSAPTDSKVFSISTLPQCLCQWVKYCFVAGWDGHRKEW